MPLSPSYTIRIREDTLFSGKVRFYCSNCFRTRPGSFYYFPRTAPKCGEGGLPTGNSWTLAEIAGRLQLEHYKPIISLLFAGLFIWNI